MHKNKYLSENKFKKQHLESSYICATATHSILQACAIHLQYRHNNISPSTASRLGVHLMYN